MITRIRPRNAMLGALTLLTLLLFGGSAPRAQPDANLPVFTSPIDITGLRVQLRIAAPDRETGQQIDVVLPFNLAGPKLNQLFATPLNTQIDQYWNTSIDPKTGMTVRQAACDGPEGIKHQVVAKVAEQGSSYSAYDISCDLATKGQLVAKQIGATLIVGYLLTKNTVSFASTSPDTCSPSGGSPFCPNNPRFTVRFATEIVTTLRTPSLCGLTAEGGTVYVLGASFEALNAAADVAKFFKGQKFLAGELAMDATVRNVPLPIDAAFNELRTSDPCTGKTPGASRILAAFRDFELVLDMRQGIILRASHPAITAPVVDAPNAAAPASASSSGVPSFTRPMISTSQPLATTGSPVQLTGLHFPPTTNFATALPVGIAHGGLGPNSVILGGVCFGGGTELEWGPVGGALRTQKLAGDANNTCAAGFAATGLTPNTAYQFRARDCDGITCSPRSAILRVTTAKLDAAKGKVNLTLDGGTPLGSTVVNAQGGFDTPITIPTGTPAGAHVIHAVHAEARADTSITVKAPAPVGGTRASIMMVGVLGGETGCPNHPISSTQTDDTFMLFGSGFAAGTATLHLDSLAGATLGTATVRPDGTICQKIRSPPANQAGAHTLVAVQSGAVVGQAHVTFVPPSVVR